MISTYSKIKAVTLCSFLLVFISCSNEESESVDEVINSHLPKDVLGKVNELKLDPDDFRYEEMLFPDGSSKRVVITEEDMSMEVDRFLKIPSNENGLDTKQYRTEFLINTGTYPTVKLIAFIGEGPNGLSENAQTALQQAVNNWNAVFASRLHLEVDFTTSPTFDPTVYQTSVFAVPNLGSSGRAQFPSEAGDPGSFVVIDAGLNTNTAVPLDAFEHLFTHEIGHSIGFRHTDWNTRQSCVDNGIQPEPSTESDAIYIFGTLPSIPGVIAQDDSIMNACFGAFTTDGELNIFDKIALIFLYPLQF